jgi:hypothetical protein
VAVVLQPGEPPLETPAHASPRRRPEVALAAIGVLAAISVLVLPLYGRGDGTYGWFLHGISLAGSTRLMVSFAVPSITSLVLLTVVVVLLAARKSRKVAAGALIVFGVGAGAAALSNLIQSSLGAFTWREATVIGLLVLEGTCELAAGVLTLSARSD